MMTSILFTPFSIKFIHLGIWYINIQTHFPCWILQSLKIIQFLSQKHGINFIKKYVQSHIPTNTSDIIISIPSVFIIHTLKKPRGQHTSLFCFLLHVCHWLSISFVLTHLYTVHVFQIILLHAATNHLLIHSKHWIIQAYSLYDTISLNQYIYNHFSQINTFHLIQDVQIKSWQYQRKYILGFCYMALLI